MSRDRPNKMLVMGSSSLQVAMVKKFLIRKLIEVNGSVDVAWCFGHIDCDVACYISLEVAPTLAKLYLMRCTCS